MLNAFLSDKGIFEKIPLYTGVYQFYEKESNLLYVGKSVCFPKRVLSHFRSMGYFSRQKRLISQIKEIVWIEKIGELGALLKGAHLIDQWCFIQTLLEQQVPYGETSINKIPRFDLDIYHILNNYLNNHKTHIKIILYQKY